MPAAVRPLLPSTIVLSAALACTGSVSAAPWINPDSVSTRLYLHQLADHGLIQLNLMTWPIAWASVDRELARIDRTALSDPALRQAYDALQFELRRQRQNPQLVEGGFRFSNETPFIQGFGQTQRETNELWMQAETRGQYWASGLRITALEGDYSDSPHLRLDGSYVAGLLGNWVLGAGALERWWGPGRTQSLVLSTNAHPTPGLFLRRLNDQALDTPWFSWMGPIHFEAFMGQLEKERDYAEPWFLGARFSFKPADALEIGLYRTAQWGGEGRPESFSSLVDLILGKDNFAPDDAGKATEPGNQFAGLDLRMSLYPLGTPGAFYAQMAGEDEANLFPSKRFWLFGVEKPISFQADGQPQTLVMTLEYVNTLAGDLEGSPKPNVAYNHSIYTSGYRFKGRSLGASVDGDAEQLSLVVDWLQSPSALVSASVSSLKLNQRGRPIATAPGGEFMRVDAWLASAHYQRQLAQLSYRVGVTVYSDELANNLANSGDFRASLEGAYRF